MWWPFGEGRKLPKAQVDTGGGFMVDLRPLSEEAFRLRPSVPEELHAQALAILVESFSLGKSAMKLKAIGFSADDADFVSNRVIKWAFGQRDAQNRADLASHKHQYFRGVELQPERERCAEAAAQAKKLFPLDKAPRIPFASCDQTICHCMIAVVSPRKVRSAKKS